MTRQTFKPRLDLCEDRNAPGNLLGDLGLDPTLFGGGSVLFGLLTLPDGVRAADTLTGDGTMSGPGDPPPYPPYPPPHPPPPPPGMYYYQFGFTINNSYDFDRTILFTMYSNHDAPFSPADVNVISPPPPVGDTVSISVSLSAGDLVYFTVPPSGGDPYAALGTKSAGSFAFSGSTSFVNEELDKLWLAVPPDNYEGNLSLTAAGNDWKYYFMTNTAEAVPVTRKLTWQVEKFDNGEYRGTIVDPAAATSPEPPPEAPQPPQPPAAQHGIDWTTLVKKTDNVKPWENVAGAPAAVKAIKGSDWEVKTFSGKTVKVWCGDPGELTTFFCHGNSFGGVGVTVNIGGQNVTRNFSPYSGAEVDTVITEEYNPVNNLKNAKNGDVVHWKNGGTIHSAVITDAKFKLNGDMDLAATKVSTKNGAELNAGQDTAKEDTLLNVHRAYRATSDGTIYCARKK